MRTKRIGFLKGLYRWLMLDRLEKRILKLLLERGRSYPGDLVKDLRLSQGPGIRKIIRLRQKGYIVREDQSSLITINPDLKDTVESLSS
ncbi:MAG: Lrp/AsnC family transcriptional regulator [Bacteroidales bacterium]